MPGAVARSKHPPGPSNAAAYLRKPLATIKRLIVLAVWMAKHRVDLIQTHEVQIIGSGQKEAATRPGDAVHFVQRTLCIGHMLDRLARNHNVKGGVTEGQSLKVPLRNPPTKLV